MFAFKLFCPLLVRLSWKAEAQGFVKVSDPPQSKWCCYHKSQRQGDLEEVERTLLKQKASNCSRVARHFLAMIQAYNNIDTSRQKSRQDDIFSRLYPFSATCATSKIHQISKFLVTVSPSKVKTKKAWLKPKLLCIHSYYSRLCQLLPPWRQSSSGTSDSGWQSGCSRSILVNLLTCVIPGQGNSKILNLIKKVVLLILLLFINTKQWGNKYGPLYLTPAF